MRNLGMNIAIGTSGFQYPEWRGTFYPSALPTAKMLAYYAKRFNTTESNYSFRRVPSAQTISNWHAKTPPGFRFSLKAPQKITHAAKLRDCTDAVEFFWHAVQGLDEKLGAILFQLPPSLPRDEILLGDFIAGLPSGMRAAFEFRHETWFVGPVIELLARSGCALCVAESAELSAPREATAGFGYLRLRREDYTDRELAEWARWIEHQRWRETFVYFKHEEKAVGPAFAATFKKLTARFSAADTQ